MFGKNTTAIAIGILFLLIVSVAIFINNSFNKFSFFAQRLNEIGSELDEEIRESYLLSLKMTTTKKVCFKDKTHAISAIEKAVSMIPETTKGNEDGVVKAQSDLYHAIEQVFVIVEKCENTEGRGVPSSLLVELRKRREKINKTRETYNQFVDKYNASIGGFPARIMASILSLKKKPRFSEN
ncbi:MAG: LemA family protein [Deltaproteobacteria bacterium]|nr:LemA family protein [Deltaproteobacteria bacterium]